MEALREDILAWGRERGTVFAQQQWYFFFWSNFHRKRGSLKMVQKHSDTRTNHRQTATSEVLNFLLKGLTLGKSIPFDCLNVLVSSPKIADVERGRMRSSLKVVMAQFHSSCTCDRSSVQFRFAYPTSLNHFVTFFSLWVEVVALEERAEDYVNLSNCSIFVRLFCCTKKTEISLILFFLVKVYSFAWLLRKRYCRFSSSACANWWHVTDNWLVRLYFMKSPADKARSFAFKQFQQIVEFSCAFILAKVQIINSTPQFPFCESLDLLRYFWARLDASQFHHH